jgi:hypothetical protein
MGVIMKVTIDRRGQTPNVRLDGMPTSRGPKAFHRTDFEASRRRANRPATSKANTWIQIADGSRQAAVMQFEIAVEQAEAAGRVDNELRQEKGASAHLLTAIVDGFLFHHFEEQVGAGRTTKELLGDLELLLDRALRGVYLKSN